METTEKKLERELYIYPIIHLTEEMKSKEEWAQAIKKLIGEYAYQLLRQKTEEFWSKLENHFQQMDVKDLKVYQDGLPIMSDELIDYCIEQTAEKGSRNYKLLKQLKNRGAKIIGTEDLRLLLERLKWSTRALKNPCRISLSERRWLNELRYKRDSFIAQRIDETLHGGEKGILLIGAMHKVENYLPQDIKVKKVYI